MFKISNENKKKLKRIYEQEYQKALADYNVKAFNEEIKRIKQQAKADAQRKAKQRYTSTAKKGEMVVKKARSKGKTYGKKLGKMSKNIERMNKDMFGI